MLLHYSNNECVIFFFCKIIPWWLQMVFNDHYLNKSYIKSIFLFIHDLLNFAENLHRDHNTQKHLN